MDLRQSEADARGVADMLSEGGGVLRPVVPTTPAPNETPAAADRWAVAERWERRLAEFSQRQLHKLSSISDPKRRLQELSDRVQRTANQTTLALELLEDFRSGVYRDIPWSTVAILVGTVAYVVNPKDIIPDFLPVLGQLDDAAVIQLAVLLLRKDLRRYCKFKGYPSSKYFR